MCEIITNKILDIKIIIKFSNKFLFYKIFENYFKILFSKITF